MIVKKDNKRWHTFDLTYEGYHGGFRPIIWVWGFDATELNADSISYDITNEDFDIEDVDTKYFIMDEFFVNKRPVAEKPSKEFIALMGSWECDASNSYDPDNDPIQYRFLINDEITTEWNSLYVYYSPEKVNSLKVQLRDSPDGDGNFDDGLTTLWSEPTSKTKTKLTDLYLGRLQYYPLLYHFFYLLNSLFHF
jgi:hypothetical protein